MWPQLPSFLTLPFSLPTLPSISLPANIQRRFLSYVLKRALGRFVKSEGLDVERIQAQISQGWVEIERLDIDAEEINFMIPPSLPLTVTSGAVSKITARVPFPNLWSDPLSLEIDSLHLEIAITTPAIQKTRFRSSTTVSTNPSSFPSTQDDSTRSHPSFPHDLASSFTSAADDFMHDELDAYEGAELDRSIRESLVLSRTDPLTSDDVPGAFPDFSPARQTAPSSPPLSSKATGNPVETTTVLASLVERILAKLECKVKDIRIRLRYEDESAARTSTFEFRISEVRYADESSSPQAETPRSTIRAIRFSSVSLYSIQPHSVSPLLPLSSSSSSASTSSPPRPIHKTPARLNSRSSSSTSFSSSSESESTTSDEVDMGATMYMSQGIADLRQSTMTAASGMSIYQSAISERVVEEEEQDIFSEQKPSPVVVPEPSSPSPVVERSRSATPTAGASVEMSPIQDKETLIISFGTDDIVLKAKNTQPITASTTVTYPDLNSTSFRPPQSSATSTSQVSSLIPSLDIDLSIGIITMNILPTQAATILAVTQAITASMAGSPSNPTAEPRETAAITQPRFTAKIKLKGIYLSFVYDLNNPSSQFTSALPQYWAKPASTYLPIGHIRLRIEDAEATYTFKGFLARPSQQSANRPMTSDGLAASRRVPASGPQPSIITVTINDLSIFEYLPSPHSRSTVDRDEPPGGAFPVLVFDPNLLKQYDIPLGASSAPLTSLTGRRRPGLSQAPMVPLSMGTAPTFPEFDVVDWRNSGLHRKGPGAGGERAWRVKQKTKGILRGISNKIDDEVSPAISIHQTTLGIEPVILEMLPFHVFLDLSLLERLLPLLRSLAPVIHPIEKEPFAHIPTLSTPQPQPTILRRGLSAHYVIEDLDVQANALSSSSRQQQRGARATSVGAKDLLAIKCPLLRVDVRCPAPPNRRGGWGDGAHLRSGIVTLDIHGLDVKLSQAGQSFGKGKMIESPENGAKVEWQKMILFFCRASEKRATAFLVIGPLAPEPGDSPDDPVLLPAVKVQSSTSALTGMKTQIVNCSIPSVQAKIRQPIVEGLQFFADDMTHWLDGAFGDGSAPKPRDDLKMIGSRFFGSKASSSASSSADEEAEEGEAKGMVFRVFISEADVALHVPRTSILGLASQGGGGGGSGLGQEATERVLSLCVSDVDVKLESNTAGRQETSLTVSAMDADFLDQGVRGIPRRIFGRITPLTLTAHTNSPLFHLRFTSLTNSSATKETGIKLALSSFCVYITKDHEWVRELALFAKPPEGVFEDVVPSEITRFSMVINDGSVHLKAPGSMGAVVCVVDGMDVRTVVESEAEENLVELVVGKAQILAIDDMNVASSLQPGLPSSFDAWRIAGYVPLVYISALEVQLIRNLAEEAILLDVLRVRIRVTACADSLATLSVLAGDLVNLVPKDKAENPSQRRPEPDQSLDVFASIDSEAFSRAPDIVSGADMIDDDLPTNLDYLDHATGQLRIDPITGETLRSWEKPEHGGRYGDASGGETIKVFDVVPFEMVENYWETLPVQKREGESKAGKHRVQVADCHVVVHLHDGFDWQRTRKTIEDEIKAVRKRLEKIRQFLASGQKADETIERSVTSTVLFNSVYIGLDRRGEDMDSAALLAAINDELDDMGAEEAASQSSWQSLPEAAGFGLGGAGSRRLNQHEAASTSMKKTRLHGRRLTRSKRPQIEITITDLSAQLDLYDEMDETSSKTNLTVGHLEILDHIKTSTWKKFLTEMKSDSRGNVRETDADMVKVELIAVRPSLPLMDEENRLRVKVLPLRLHVDQDALDFLKRFFSFTPPVSPDSTGVTPSRGAKDPPSEPFFQRVEIFPIELKLDYKPKRVDYAALRQGKTIELMNFFHFDGAEMTLRHVTMSGVSGWTRLSTALQDIWTPDVKANQLADVISGVAPIRSLVNVGSGVADLILLPIEQYRKDGRVARGVQRGTNSFVRSTAMEMMKLGARLATGTQVILERAETVLGGRFGADVVGEVAGAGGDGLSVGGSVSRSREGGRRMDSRRRNEFDEDDSDEDDEYGMGGGLGGIDHVGAGRVGVVGGNDGGNKNYYKNRINVHAGGGNPSDRQVQVSRFADQPADVREGIQAAYASLSRNINSAAQTILAVPMEVYERSNDASGQGGPIRAVVRAVPIAVLKPMIGASEAVSKTLLGIRNSLDPETKRELGDKYK